MRDCLIVGHHDGRPPRRLICCWLLQMNLDDMLYNQHTDNNFKHAIHSSVKGAAKSQAQQNVRNKDKSDRATTDQAMHATDCPIFLLMVGVLQVLDPRTRMILFKMLNQGVITEINGCISTGKEANVYHARLPDGSEGAIKVRLELQHA
jgi:serine/threonine-protein kinase RIO1